MINVWSVSQLLEDSGILSQEHAKKAMPFCLSACASLSTRLKKPEYEDEPAVITACAGIALCSYLLLCGSSLDEFDSFKAGDITVTKSASATNENAVKFRDDALVNAAPFLTDVDFAFEAVEI